ncbi:tetratricopeptide repeat protein [bacterium]|nr:tetratricopeptide repeat protein [bacterium]
MSTIPRLATCIVMLLAPLALDAAEPAPPRAPPVARRPAPPTFTRPGTLPATPEMPPEKLPAQYYASLGQTYIRYSQWTQAEEAYRQAYEKEKDGGRRADHAYSLAQLCMRRQGKDRDKALPLLEEAVKNAPTRASAYKLRRYRQTLAVLYEDMKQLDKAEAIYRGWLEQKGASHERMTAQREYLGFLKRTNKLDEAIAGFEAALKEKPNDKQTLETLRLIYRSIKPDAARALALAQKVLEADPGNRDAALQLVTAYEAAKKYDKCIALVEGLLERDPKDSGGYLTSRLIGLYRRNGQTEKAIAMTDRMVATGMKTGYDHSRAASYYQQLGQIDKALAQYEAAVGKARTPQEKEGHILSIAYTARRAKKYEKAEAAIRKLVQSNSKTMVGQAKRLLFEIYEEQNKLDQLEVTPGAKK